MHIAIEASTWASPRGYGRFTRELTGALLRAGAKHTFTLVVDSGAAGATDLPDAPILVVPTRHAVANGADGSRSIPDILRIAYRLSRGFDAVLFPTNYSFVPVWPGPLVVLVIHDAIPEAMPSVLGSKTAQLRWNLKNRIVSWRSDVIATVSKASAREISKYLDIGEQDLVMLTEGAAAVFGAQPGSDDQRRVEEVLPGASRYVLYVGGLSPHKRVPELIRAFGAVAGAPALADLRLVLAGPRAEDTFTADKEGVSGALAALGATADRVIQTGFVPDATLAALYRRAECAVLPSRVEGFGLPAIEAMASGTPLIVARNPAVEEVCGSSAEYVDSISDLAMTLRRLLDDKVRRDELRRAGVERAGLFGWDTAAARLLAALNRFAT